MNLKKFRDVEVRKVYVTANKFPIEIEYKLFNDQVIIDIKKLIDGILDEQGISKYATERVEVQIPYDMQKVVSGNSIIFGVDKKRFLINIPSGQIITNNQQKIDYDNTHPHRWKLPQWLKFIENLFYKYYGFKAIELDVNAENNSFKRGKVFGLIRNIINKILAVKVFKCDENTVIEYLDWVFSTKHMKVNITLSFLCSDIVIQDWIINKLKNMQEKKVRKWDDNN